MLVKCLLSIWSPILFFSLPLTTCPTYVWLRWVGARVRVRRSQVAGRGTACGLLWAVTDSSQPGILSGTCWDQTQSLPVLWEFEGLSSPDGVRGELYKTPLGLWSGLLVPRVRGGLVEHRPSTPDSAISHLSQTGTWAWGESRDRCQEVSLDLGTSRPWCGREDQAWRLSWVLALDTVLLGF